MNGDGGRDAEAEDVEEEIVVHVVKPPGTGLGISIAGGVGATPFRGDDEVDFVFITLTFYLHHCHYYYYYYCHYLLKTVLFRSSFPDAVCQ